MSMMFALDTEMEHKCVEKVENIQPDTSERAGSPKEITDLDKMQQMNQDDSAWDSYAYLPTPSQLDLSSPIPEVDEDTNWDIEEMLNGDAEGSSRSTRCTLCDVTFNNLGDFEEHVQAHEAGEFEDTLEDHSTNEQQQQHETEEFENHVTGELEDHIISQEVEEEDSYDYEISELEKHMRPQDPKSESEEEDENYSQNPDATYVNPDMENGSETEDEEDVVRYKCRKCKICNKSFRSDETLRRHLKSHSAKVHQCEVCKGKFSSAHSLNRHKTRIHANQKPYLCRLCGLNFLNNQALYRHRDTHIQQQSQENNKGTQKNTFTCRVCSKVYSRKSKLFEHMDTHSNINIKCQFCEEELTYLALQVHIKKNHIHEVCQICDKNFIDKKLFLIHEKDHFNVNDNTCDYCQSIFEEQAILFVHMMTEHVGNTEDYKCEYCLKLYHSERHLKYHRSFSHLAVCQVCDKRFNRHSDLGSHMKQAHRLTKTVEPTKCRLCQAEFASRSRLATHLTHTHGLASPYRCRLCKSGFRNLKEHRKQCKALPTARSHDEDSYLDTVEINFGSEEKNTFQCPFCDKPYENQPNLKKHMLRKHKDITHDSDVKRYTCKLCKKSYLTNHELMIHSKVHSEARAYNCTICSKSYKYQVNLTQHYKEAHAEKSYPCKHCDELFNTRLELKKHKSSKHPEEVKATIYKCQQCSKILSSSFALKTHMTVHSDERPFKCDVCGQTYKTEQILNRHVQAVHVGDKNFTCDYCDASFKTNTVLNKHKYRRHRDKAPQTLIDKYDSQKIKCEICHKEMSNKSRLMNHMRTHSNEKPMECSLCSLKFSTKYTLVRHIRNTHSDHEGYEKLLKVEIALLEAETYLMEADANSTGGTTSEATVTSTQVDTANDVSSHF